MQVEAQVKLRAKLLRASPWLLLLLCIPVTAPVNAQAQQADLLPDAAFLEFLGSFNQQEEEVLELALDAIEDETEQTRAKHVVPAKDKTHETN